LNQPRLHKLLRNHAGITEALLADLNLEAANTKRPLMEVVVRRGLLTQERFYQLLSRELNIPFVDVTNYVVDPALISIIPTETAHRLQVVPLYRIGDALTVATADPEHIGALDELHHALGLQINPMLADPEAVREVINEYYQSTRPLVIEGAATDAEADDVLRYIESEATEKSAEQLASEAPIVRFVNAMLERAASDRASDIHVEPEADLLRVRLRVDGLLKESGRFPLRLHAPIVSRVKILSGMDISDRRRAQDGRFDFTWRSRQVDVRVSTFPTIFGENLVMRLLDKTSGQLKLPDLGMSPDMAAHFENAIGQPHGIILVTGPTGSGKTTTLYAVLGALNSIEKNIITLEDPVEYQLPVVRQCQINPRADITFASGLRSILRQDPDLLLVGEIRDGETAEIAFQAALTGHLVLSTLHTNDAAGALTRLIDMNVEPFLISSSVIAILAQRLVRRVCDRCRTSYVPAAEVLGRLGIAAGTKFSRGAGCPSCSMRGFRGRAGIYELLLVSAATRRMVMEKRSSEEIKARALTEGMRTLRDDAVAKAVAGLTTPEEVLRVTPDRS
jgi:type IV pilus assembly protein PilB